MAGQNWDAFIISSSTPNYNSHVQAVLDTRLWDYESLDNIRDWFLGNNTRDEVLGHLSWMFQRNLLTVNENGIALTQRVLRQAYAEEARYQARMNEQFRRIDDAGRRALDIINRI